MDVVFELARYLDPPGVCGPLTAEAAVPLKNFKDWLRPRATGARASRQVPEPRGSKYPHGIVWSYSTV